MANLLTLTIEKKTNVLDGIVCYEPIHMETLDKLLQTDLLHVWLDDFGDEEWNDETQLIKYKNKINRETKLATVEYNRNKGMSYGRCNPKANLGLFTIRREIRNTFAKKAGLRDFDIKNAHPDILLQVCKQQGFQCDKLEYYVGNRDNIMNQLISITGCSKDRAKGLFIRLLYFGSFENWLDEKRNGNKIEQPKICYEVFQKHPDFTTYIFALVEQLKKIGHFIVQNNPKIVKEVEKNKELKQKKSYNMVGSVVSYFLQEYEVRILECLYNYCIENYYIINNEAVLCADGIVLKGSLIQNVDICSEFNTVVHEKIGFNLQFVEKDTDEYYSDEFIESRIITSASLDSSMFDRLNQEYFASLSNYHKKKVYFESFICKVIRPDPVYIYLTKEGGFDDMSFYTQNKLVESFRQLGSGDFNKNGEETSFIIKWLDDATIKCYDKMDFLPSNIKEPIPSHIFNLFRGFNPDCYSTYDISKTDKILAPFFELGTELCGGNREHFNFFIRYIADIIQFPNKKNPLAFIIKGKQGTGKNVFLNAVGNILGRQHYITSSNPKDFFGDYAEGFYHKLLVNMNECEGKDTFDFEGKIKSFITEDTITLNRKFVQPVVISNLARLVIFTNKSNPIPIDVRSRERRYVVFETTDKFLNKKYGTSFWKALITHFNRPEFIACLYNYLNTLDIANYDWRTNRPITDAYISMCRLYVPVEALFLQHKLSSSTELDFDIKGVDLYKEYTDYCSEFGFKKDSTFQKTIKSFYSKLTELGLPISTKQISHQTSYCFNRISVLEDMVSKSFINKDDDDIIEMDNKEVDGDDFTDYFTI